MLPNFRKNPLTGHWVIVAEGRQTRPNEFRSQDLRSAQARCPFCAGHEDDTPGVVAAYDLSGPIDNDQEWVVRVVPNKYPALETELPLHSPLETRLSEASFLSAHGLEADDRDAMFGSEDAAGLSEAASYDVALVGSGNAGDDGVVAFGPYHGFFSGGIHELVVESRTHTASFGDLQPDERKVAVRVYQDRLRRVAERPELRFGMVFKNCRPGAGASIEHAHSQLIGTTVVPSAVRQRRRRALHYRQRFGKPLMQDMVQFERDQKLRVVAETDRFVAFCPFASHLAFETWIFPKKVSGTFLEAEQEELDEFSELLFDCVSRAESVLDAPPYNFTFHLAPFDSPADDDYQWHVELAPRLTKLAGFEWGTGCMILPVAPETAADRLREAGRK